MHIFSACDVARYILAALALIFAPAWAQGDFPTKAVRIIVPYAEGTATDLVIRAVGERLAESLGKPVLIENHLGAGADLGSFLVSKEEADGYTLLAATPANAVNMTLLDKPAYDTARDFVAVARIGYAPLVMVAPVTATARTVAQIVAEARAKPGRLNYASTGNATMQHLAGEMFRLAAGLYVVHVPQPDAAAAIVDLMAGRIAYLFANPIEVIDQVQIGRLRALAVAGEHRPAFLASVPTMIEAGYADFEATLWWGLLAPAKTPELAVSRLYDHLIKALSHADMPARLGRLGGVIAPMAPDQFGNFVRAEIKRWGEVIKAANVRLVERGR